MNDAGDHYSYLCSLKKRPYLQIRDARGVLEEIPRSSIVGMPRFPSLCSSGEISYVSTGDLGGTQWISKLVILSPDYELIDLVPGAAPYCPPAWSPAGDRCCFVRFDASTGSGWPVIYTLDTGHETPAAPPEIDLRGVTWLDDGTLLTCGSSWIDSLDLESGDRTRLHAWSIAEGFHDFGTDDEFVTLDQPAFARGASIAIVVTWQSEGRRGAEQVRTLQEGHLVPVRPGFSRRPVWRDDGRLVLTSEQGLEVWDLESEGTRAELIRIADLHSAVVVP